MTHTYRMIVGACLFMSLLLTAQASAHADGTAPQGVGPAGSPPPAAEAAPLELRLKDGGAVVAKVTSTELSKVKPLPTSPGVGGKARLTSLKDALALWVAPGTRAVDVVLADGKKVIVDENVWNDARVVPVLWQNRRGLWKLGYVDDKGVALGGKDKELKDIRAIEIVKAAPADAAAPAKAP